MRKKLLVCLACVVFIVVFAGMAATMYWLGYSSGIMSYKKHDITFVKRDNGLLTVSVGAYHMDVDTDTFVLRKNFEGLVMPQPLMMESINYDAEGSPDSILSAFGLFPPGNPNPILTVTSDFSSGQVRESQFSFVPSPEARPFGKSSYIDKDGDGVFDVWMIHPDDSAIPPTILHLQTLSPYIVDSPL